MYVILQVKGCCCCCYFGTRPTSSATACRCPIYAFTLTQPPPPPPHLGSYTKQTHRHTFRQADACRKPSGSYPAVQSSPNTAEAGREGKRKKERHRISVQTQTHTHSSRDVEASEHIFVSNAISRYRRGPALAWPAAEMHLYGAGKWKWKRLQ